MFLNIEHWYFNYTLRFAWNVYGSSWYEKKVKNKHFYSKMAWPCATYDVMSHHRSNRFPPNLTKMCLKEQLLKTACANNECFSKDRRKTLKRVWFKLIREKKWKTNIFIQKWLDVVLLMTSCPITVATDSLQTWPKCVSRNSYWRRHVLTMNAFQKIGEKP